MNSSRNTKYGIGIALMLLLNVFLIYTNYNKNIIIADMANSITMNEDDGHGDEFDNGEMQFLPAKFSDPLNLILVYPKEYCGSCIDMDLPILQEIAEMYPSIIYVVNNGIKYNMISLIDSNSEKVSLLDFAASDEIESFLQVELPKIYLVDSSGQIILSYQSIFGDINSHKAFFERVLSLLSITYVNLNH